MTNRPQITGAAFGLTAAVLFGVSAPLAKLLLADIQPLMLAGLLYLGGGTGLLLLRLIQSRNQAHEATLQKGDLALLCAIIISGGILGPVLMLLGLQRVSGLAGSLLLNLEGPFTILLAVVFFGEYLGRSLAVAAALIFSGAAVLGWQPGAIQAEWVGIILLFAACFSWALDNNLTQRLSLRDPVSIALVKTFTAGAFNVAAGSYLGNVLPRIELLAFAMLLGFFSYGVSIVLDIYALRVVGAVRESAYFATAPFIGAVFAIPLLDERLSVAEALSFVLMALGVTLMLRENHSHIHEHHELEHEHLHAHDEHHQHAHSEPVSGPHSHHHWHFRLVHSHPHVPDLHHRHRHGTKKNR